MGILLLLFFSFGLMGRGHIRYSMKHYSNFKKYVFFFLTLCLRHISMKLTKRNIAHIGWDLTLVLFYDLFSLFVIGSHSLYKKKMNNKSWNILFNTTIFGWEIEPRSIGRKVMSITIKLNSHWQQMSCLGGWNAIRIIENWGSVGMREQSRAEWKLDSEAWKQWKRGLSWKLWEPNEFHITRRAQNARSKHRFWIRLQLNPILNLTPKELWDWKRGNKKWDYRELKVESTTHVHNKTVAGNFCRWLHK